MNPRGNMLGLLALSLSPMLEAQEKAYKARLHDEVSRQPQRGTVSNRERKRMQAQFPRAYGEPNVGGAKLARKQRRNR